MEFRERFPEQAKTLEEIQNAASQFKTMMLGTDDATAWSLEDHRIAELLLEAEENLADAIEEIWMGRLKPAMISLRCFLEQVFFALYYSEQSLDFSLWQRDPKHFVMLHQLYESKHCFYKYFAKIFKERRDPDWKEARNPGTFTNRIFEVLEDLYSDLSASVHGRPKQREQAHGNLTRAEVETFILRVRGAIAICSEFFDVAGTGEESPIPRQFRFSKETKVR